MLKNYIYTAIRSFLRRKTFTIINVIGLSFGITACLLVYLYLNDEMNFDRQHLNYSSIYRINSEFKYPDSGWEIGGSISPIAALEISRNIPGFELFSRFNNGAAVFERNNEFEYQYFLYADPDLFKIFTFPLLTGEIQSLYTDPNSIVLSRKKAINLFGHIDVVGNTMELSIQGQKEFYTIRAVTEEVSTNSTVPFEMVIPFSKYAQLNPQRLEKWGDWHVSTFVLLNENSNIKQLEKTLTDFAKTRINEGDQGNYKLDLQPLGDIHLNQEIRGGNGVRRPVSSTTSYSLIAIALFIVIIASINFTNLSIGMNLSRLKEIGVRKVNGATVGHIRLQFIGEVAILVLASIILSILSTDLLTGIFSSYTQKSLSLRTQINTNTVLAIFSLLVIITFIAGGYPALLFSRINAISSLKGKIRLKNKLTTKVLVITQFSLAVIFIMGWQIMNNQIQYFNSIDKGYNDRDIISVFVWDIDGNSALEALQNKLSSNSNIKSIAGSVGGRNRTFVNINGKDEMIRHERIDFNYLETFEVTLIAGRNFDPNKLSDNTNSIIVNERMVEKLGITMEEALGTQVDFNYFENMKMPKIIGVVKDFNLESLKNEVSPLILYTNPEKAIGEIFIKSENLKLSETLNNVKTAWYELYPQRPFRHSFLEDENKNNYSNESTEKEIIQFAGLISIVISCLGLFALSSFHVNQRTKEVGIKKVLGANLTILIRDLSKEYSTLILISMAIGFPIAYFTFSQWLESFAYQANIEFVLFAKSFLIIGIISILAISYQTIKAALSNPVNSLKND